MNKILKDMIVKSKTLGGFNAPYVPGWDCHGLPIELEVEKRIGKAGDKAAPNAFRRTCRDYALQQIKKQSADFQRLGIMGDWKNPYLTMDYQVEANIVRALGRIVIAGHIDKGFKPVHWCTDCGSALAEAEVEYEFKDSLTVDVRFAVLEDESLLARCHHAPERLGLGPLSMVIWTTTPWTLPANQAVAVHPDLEYAIVQCDEGQFGQERLMIAEALLKDTMFRYGIDRYHVIAYCQGKNLEGIQLKHPFYDRQVPIILGEFITTEVGTGGVHIAPGHGEDDYIVGKRYGLPIYNPVDNRGCFLPDTPLFAGEHVSKANEHIIDVLKAQGKLLHEQRIRHSYPHCWRHKTPIIFRATPQWFISMDKKGLREQALAAIKNVKWIPDWGQQRIEGMIANRPDWCISRQRTWGVPIPLFVHKSTGALHPKTMELIEIIAKKIEKEGIDAWFELEKGELIGDEGDFYHKVTDTLDVWFDSGVTHATVLETRELLSTPADLYLEGSDQHRGWFNSSLMTSVAMNKGVSPYKSVLTHGFTVDAQGRKMSKSLGNVVAPQQVIKNLGADILRLWVSATDFRGEITVSDEILKRIADAYRRLRNTTRFLLANLHDFDPKTDCVAPEHLLALDCWAVDRAYHLQQEIIHAYDNYQFHLVYQKIHHFCAVEMGSLYLDIIKDRQYTCQKHSVARRSAQTALYHIVEALVRWFAPILSFTADEIWRIMPGERNESVHLATWYTGLFPLSSQAKVSAATWTDIIHLREWVSKELEKLRVAGTIGASLEAEVDIYCDDALYQQLAAFGEELRFIFITSRATVHPIDQRTAEAIEYEAVWIATHVSVHPKCTRCWHHRDSVGHDVEHPQLCARCVENVAQQGEQRFYA